MQFGLHGAHTVKCIFVEEKNNNYCKLPSTK
jgi:hypothetical protein